MVGTIGVIVVLIGAGAGIAIRMTSSGSHRPSGAPCQATVGSAFYPLDLDQAANATTIAAVGKRMGLPDHAVTIALAAAMQESELHNVSSGDLDSVGLFQQRPSQGWGTPSQIRVPSYAARVFYQHLAAVPGWQAMAVTAAAQSVQRSAAPDAYAQWEPAARLLAQVLTGEAPAGLGCRFTKPGNGPINSTLTRAMTDELGVPSFGVVVAPAWGWTVASWVVGHAQQYHVKSVTFAGQRWTPARRTWSADSHATDQIQIA
ncbi:MAG TPA: hypothetical protein VLL25_10375 [Acidimicrobiales bacterium]|nr:hypothetical protein [Acidimicrobiales bacterium]